MAEEKKVSEGIVVFGRFVGAEKSAKGSLFVSLLVGKSIVKILAKPTFVAPENDLAPVKMVVKCFDGTLLAEV